VAARRRALVVWRLRSACLGDPRDDLLSDEDSTHDLLRRGLVYDERHAGRLCPGPAASARDWLVQDRLTMLHRYRSAMVRAGRDRLSGVVEADETFLGGPEPGVPGRGALGKLLVEVAVESAPEAPGAAGCRSSTTRAPRR